MGHGGSLAREAQRIGGQPADAEAVRRSETGVVLIEAEVDSGG